MIAERKWEALEQAKAELAARLRLLLSKPVNRRTVSARRAMVQMAAFSAAILCPEREMIEPA